MSEQMLILGDFTLKSLLGKGHRSEVRVGECGTDQFAIKCIKRIGNNIYDSYSYKCYLNEVKHVTSLTHPHIVSIVTHGDCYIFSTENLRAESTLYIVFEYAKGGSLFDFVKITGAFSEQLARYYFSTLLDTLLYLHCSGVAHRDIKPQNILLNSSFDVLLADFDLAGPIGIYEGIVGTSGYMAPEIESKCKYSAEKTDIFALGVVLFFIVMGRNPFTSTLANTHYNALCSHKSKFWERFDKKGSLSIEFKDLVEKLLEKDSSKRLSIEEIKQHPWMNKQTISDLELAVEKLLRKEKIESNKVIVN